MIAVIAVSVAVLCTLLGATGLYFDSIEKASSRSRKGMDKVIARSLEPKPSKGNFVKIGSMPAEFNADMHTCLIDEVDVKAYSIGDVLACQNPDCNREYILGWYLSSVYYKNSLQDLPSVRDKKKWVPMEAYERNPGEYVYSK